MGTTEEQGKMEQPTQTQKPAGSNMKKKKSKKPIIIAVVIVVVIGVAVAGFFIWKNSQKKSTFWFDDMAKNGLLDGKTPDEIQGLIDQVVEEGMFNISINSNPTFKTGTSEGNLRIENVPKNNYYMKVVITLDKTGETVYESGGLKQEQFIEKAKLKVDLDKGEYPATALFTAIDPNTLDPVGTTAAQITISVLE